MKLSFPVLLIPVALYNLLAFLTVVGRDWMGTAEELTDKTVISMPMIWQGTELHLSLGALILVVALVCLFIEVITSTSSSNEALLGDALGVGLFVICLIELILLPPFATQTFLLLTAMVLMNALAGFIVTTVSARQDIDIGG